MTTLPPLNRLQGPETRVPSTLPGASRSLQFACLSARPCRAHSRAAVALPGCDLRRAATRGKHVFRRSKDDDESSTVKEMAKGAAKTAAASKIIGAMTSDDEEEEKSGGKGKFVALLLAGAGALYLLKKRRETERPLPRA